MTVVALLLLFVLVELCRDASLVHVVYAALV